MAMFKILRASNPLKSHIFVLVKHKAIGKVKLMMIEVDAWHHVSNLSYSV